MIALAQQSLEQHTNIRAEFNLTYDLGMCCGGIVEVFIEIIYPPNQLVIYGAGHVGMALAKIAIQLDYHVILVDPRTDFVTPPPEVQFFEAHPLDVLEQLPFGARCDHFITTHEHSLDQDILMAIQRKEVRYLGMIGSKTKKYKFQMRFEAGEYNTDIFAKLNTPAGIDIGAQTPMEIAISIAAQLISIRKK